MRQYRTEHTGAGRLHPDLGLECGRGCRVATIFYPSAAAYRMRILAMFFHYPPISGGGVVVITSILNTMAKMGHDVTVIAPLLDWDGPKYQPEMDPRIRTVRTHVQFGSRIKIAARLCQYGMKKAAIREGRAAKFDFVFSIFHPFHLAPKAAVEAASELGIPCVVKIDDAVYQMSSGLKSLQRRAEKAVSSRTLRAASSLLVSNELSGEIVAAEYGVDPARIMTVPNGVDLSMFHAADRRDGLKIIFTGAIYGHRGLEIMISAMPRIIQRVKGAKLVVVGDGPTLGSLREVAAGSSAGESMEFAGWVERDLIPGYVADASVGLASLRETEVTRGALPIKVLEYMAASLPLIAKRGTLTGEILADGKNGYLVDNEDDLVEKASLLLSDPGLAKRMGEESRRMVRRYSWDTVVGEIIGAAQQARQKHVGSG
ncbi:glycosyltransferase [Cenarchaeum symbiosum A]|uniref:Glycosyltransferase n=1 Tax=Cenarchaeum symbiosum (strain A) TaxID=414004 RepID=A0RWB3_CENSY|nr:glycosyltransferase [Cenarchaeum symbiosum A]